MWWPCIVRKKIDPAVLIHASCRFLCRLVRQGSGFAWLQHAHPMVSSVVASNDCLSNVQRGVAQAQALRAARAATISGRCTPSPPMTYDKNITMLTAAYAAAGSRTVPVLKNAASGVVILCSVLS